MAPTNEPTRQDDEDLLAIIQQLEDIGVILADEEGPIPYRLSLAQMAFGSDESAERAFHRLVTAYDGGNQ